MTDEYYASRAGSRKRSREAERPRSSSKHFDQHLTPLDIRIQQKQAALAQTVNFNAPETYTTEEYKNGRASPS